jgi:hypothetical protein
MPLNKESRMQMAISAYKKKKIKSKQKAAEVFGVSWTTLCACLDGRKSCSETCANGHKLTKIKEDVLVKKLLDADKHGFSV